MFHKVGRSILYGTVYFILIVGILWQGFALTKHFRPVGFLPKTKSIRVNIEGNVLRPGLYRVPEGTTTFEILKVAGIRSTSDISSLTLTTAITDNSELVIGNREKGIGLKEQLPEAVLEFFTGEMSVTTSEGLSVTPTEGMVLNRNNRIIMDANGQAEISTGTFTRIDLDNFSEIIVDTIAVDENKIKTNISQLAGICLYKVVYSNKNEEFRIATPLASILVGGNGAEFLVEIKSDQVIISVISGLLLAEKTGTKEALNLISSQSITAFNDSRPLQVGRLSLNSNPADRFSELMKKRTLNISKNMPLNFIFCSPPFSYYLISVQFDKNIVHAVPIPSGLLVDEFAQGIQFIDESYLYGGPVFVSTLMEKIFNVRIPKYAVLDKDDIIKVVASIGGITVNVDAKAAQYLKIPAGPQKLSEKKIVEFLLPSISGIEDSKTRQINVLKALFSGIKGKNIILTSLLTDQILSGVETNFRSSDVMDNYTKFMNKSNWTIKTPVLPVTSARRGERICYQAKREECRGLLRN